MTKLRAVVVSAYAEAAKHTKKEVNYSKGMRKSRCEFCKYYHEDSTCDKVKGAIQPDMWCKLFKTKD